MAAPRCLAEILGAWSGISELHMSWMEDEDERVKKGPASVEIELDPARSFAKVGYLWALDGEIQHGAILTAANEDGEVSAGWVDSWHMNSEVMAMKGSADGLLNLRGSYRVEGHPDWGWRIMIQKAGEELQLLMFNIDPDGNEEWAVRGSYRRG